MENVLGVVNAIAWFAGSLGAAISVIYIVYSGYLFMSAEGDPRRMAQARTSLIGVVIGIVLIGAAFIIPTTISRYVIEPSGGVRVEPRSGVDCDGVLRDQLVFQRRTKNPDQMQFLVSRIQAQRDECQADFWAPVVKVGQGHPNGCIETVDSVHQVGGVPVPDGLTDGASVRNTSYRDGENNIIVFWVHPSDTDPAHDPLAGLPSDGSVCWMFVAAFGAWTEAYRPSS